MPDAGLRIVALPLSCMVEKNKREKMVYGGVGLPKHGVVLSMCVILLYLNLLRLLLIGDGGTGCRIVQTLRGRPGSLAFCHGSFHVSPIPKDVHRRQEEEHTANDFHKAGREQGVL